MTLTPPYSVIVPSSPLRGWDLQNWLCPHNLQIAIDFPLLWQKKERRIGCYYKQLPANLVWTGWWASWKNYIILPNFHISLVDFLLNPGDRQALMGQAPWLSPEGRARRTCLQVLWCHLGSDVKNQRFSLLFLVFLSFNSHLALVGGRRLQPVDSLKIALLTWQVKSYALKRSFSCYIGSVRR